MLLLVPLDQSISMRSNRAMEVAACAGSVGRCRLWGSGWRAFRLSVVPSPRAHETHLEAAGAGVQVSLRTRQLSSLLLRRRLPCLDRLRGLLHLQGGRALQLFVLKPRVSHVNALDANWGRPTPGLQYL